MQYSSLIPSVIDISLEAGAIIMKHFGQNGVVEIKTDNSPVTQADKDADKFISDALRKLTPNIPVISEEGDVENLPRINTYWLVDPLDGTRSFIKGENEFTVNVGLVVDNKAYMGVIFAPALNKLYYTWINGKAYKQLLEYRVQNSEGGVISAKAGNNSQSNHNSSWLDPNFCWNDICTLLKPIEIKVSPKPQAGEGYRVIASKNHRNQATEDYIKNIKVKEFIACSSSLKLCLIAEGRADIYPRFGNTMQWDTCAGQAILEAAGGKMVAIESLKEFRVQSSEEVSVQNSDNRTLTTEFTYKFNPLDHESLRNPHFIASN